MADVVITIPVSDVEYVSWLRTSYIASNIKDGEGNPMVISNEIGPDQIDVFTNLIKDASIEVLKLFSSRQGDAVGVPYEFDGNNITYRFNEATPVLPQAVGLKAILEDDVRNALYTYVTIKWFEYKTNADQVAILNGIFEKLSNNIHDNLYRLHD